MMNFINTLLDYPVIVLFLLANLGIGWWAYMRSKANSFEDYALASRSLPTAVLVMTLLGTLLDNGIFNKANNAFGSTGLLEVGSIAAYILSFALVGSFIAPYLVYFNGCMTLGDVMEKLYGRVARISTGVISAFVCLLMIYPQLQAMAEIGDSLLNIPIYQSVIGLGFLIMFYSIMGGMRSVSYTDVFQILAVIITSVCILQVMLSKLGGIEKVLSALPEDNLRVVSHPKFTSKLKSWTFWRLIPVFLLTPPVIQRMLVVQDKRKVTRMWYTSSLLYSLIALIFISIGLTAIPGSKQSLIANDGKATIINIIKSLFSDSPWIMQGLVFGLMAVGISTIDSYLHSVGILLVQDVWEPLFGSRVSMSGHRSKVTYAKLGIVLIALLSILLASMGGGIFFNKKIFELAVLIYTLVIIPAIIGVVGIKTDNVSWGVFSMVYILSLLLQRWIGLHGYFIHVTNMGKNLAYTAAIPMFKYENFFVALLLALISYFLTHIYINGGIVTFHRQSQTTAEKLWVFSWQGMVEGLRSWLYGTFNLVHLARMEVAKGRPTQSLAFSLCIFFLYSLSSVLGGGQGGEGFPEFMAAIHLFGIALCCGLMLEGVWPHVLQAYFPLYWLVTLFYCLPLGGTVTFLRMHEDVPSMFLFVGSFMLLAFLVSSRAFVGMSMWGLVLGHVGWYIVGDALPRGLGSSPHYLGAMFVLVMLMVAVLSLGHQAEVHMENRLYINRALSDAVTHEARHHLTPMRGVSFFVDRVDHSLEPTTNAAGEQGFFLPARMKVHVAQSAHQIDEALDSVSEEFINFQDIIHSDLYDEVQERVGMASLVEEALLPIRKRYEDMLTIEVKRKQDFEAYVIRPFFSNVLGNIARNAHTHGRAKRLCITIDGGQRKIYLRDNGKGIPSGVLPRIFDVRFTTRQGKNHGVGLALVKLILAFSGITISCRSRHGDQDAFTEFVLAFTNI